MPLESPDSYNDIVFILMLFILPVPLCKTPLFTGVDEPVKIICPLLPFLSTKALVASHKAGTSCHSSIKRGVSPFKTV
ncbi:unknown [Firmicutes bacterium CAG:449]|nr:unknown [Firmicutes bacterium CAG:449]